MWQRLRVHNCMTRVAAVALHLGGLGFVTFTVRSSAARDERGPARARTRDGHHGRLHVSSSRADGPADAALQRHRRDPAGARPAAPAGVVVLTTFDTDENVLRALRAGAGGFLLKDTPPRADRRGGPPRRRGWPQSPTITGVSCRAPPRAESHDRARAALRRLSPREREVALAIARGRSNGDIAAELYMSVATVKARLARAHQARHRQPHPDRPARARRGSGLNARHAAASAVQMTGPAHAGHAG
jgi:DNA-binding NarL/FixJ family response regulator